MALDLKLESFKFKSKEEFSFYLREGGELYHIKVGERKIKVYKKEDYEGFVRAFDYDLKKDKPFWYISHVCGLSGFEDSGDTCYACKYHGVTSKPKIGKDYFISKLGESFMGGEPEVHLKEVCNYLGGELERLFSNVENSLEKKFNS